MFIREKKNRSGSVSIQIISKVRGKYKVVKTIGCATERHKIDQLKLQAKQQMEERQHQPSLFASSDDQLVEQAFSSLSNSHIRTVGPELIFGKIYDHLGFGAIGEPLFRHLVIARLAFPLSKLKTAGYLYRYQGVWIDSDKIYRFLDKLNNRLKERVEQIAFAPYQANTERRDKRGILRHDHSLLRGKRRGRFTKYRLQQRREA